MDFGIEERVNGRNSRTITLKNGLDTVMSPSRPQNGRQDHRSMGETWRLILDELEQAPHGMTCLQLARALDRKKTPHFFGVLRTMLRAGLICEITTSAKNGVLQFLYTLPYEDQS